MAKESVQRGGPAVDAISERVFRRIEQSGALPPDVSAPEAAGAVLCVLSRRLSSGEAVDLAEALPSTLQAIVQPCAAHRQREAEVFGRRDFLDPLARHLDIDTRQAEAVTRSVFQAVRVEMDPREIDDVSTQLPADLRSLWGPRRAAA